MEIPEAIKQLRKVSEENTDAINTVIAACEGMADCIAKLQQRVEALELPKNP